MPDCIEVLDQAYKQLAEEQAVNRPRSHMFTSTDEPGLYHLFKSLEGTVKKWNVVALRINSELWKVSKTDKKIDKLPLSDGRFTEFIMLFSASTGQLLAILPDGLLQKTRVAATHGLATKYLARSDSRTLGLFGTGWQASAQILAQTTVRPIETVKVYSPNRDHRNAFANRMSSQVEARVEPVEKPELVMRGSDVVVGATNSTVPVIRAAWLSKGMHLSSVRAWGEVERPVMGQCDVVFVHNHNRCDYYFAGDGVDKDALSHGAGLELEKSEHPELCDIVAGKIKGRTNPEQISFFVDGDRAGGPGLGIQFAAVGFHVFSLAKKKGLGQELPDKWFTDLENHPGAPTAAVELQQTTN
jgi:alanine dehydrogenase